METKIPVLLDGDPGHDDAIAWTLAKASDRMNILGISATAGNQTVDKTGYNALRIAALLHLNCPVAKGATKPLLAPLHTAGNFHGESGLDGPELPAPVQDFDPRGAVAMMADVLQNSEQKVTIIVTGAQTNVAALLISYPELKGKIERISFMGGGLSSGNWTPAAEFNIWQDPEAAKVVFNSGIPLEMCGLDVTEKALIYPSEFDEIRRIDNPIAKIVAGWLDFFYKHHQQLGFAGAPLHDPCAVLTLLHPELFTKKDLAVDVDLDGIYTRGATVADLRDPLSGRKMHPANCRCAVGVDRDKFVETIKTLLHAYDQQEGL